MATAWELIGFDGRDGLVRIKGGRTLYESVDFNCDTAGENVRLSRLDQVKCADGQWRLRQIDRYVAPDTILEVVADR